MRELTVDAALFTSKRDTHAALRAVLGGENYYGSNLDALHDCLTSVSEPVSLRIIHWSRAVKNLGAYADALWHTLDDSADENRFVIITLE